MSLCFPASVKKFLQAMRAFVRGVVMLLMRAVQLATSLPQSSTFLRIDMAGLILVQSNNNNSSYIGMAPKRQIKKTVIHYAEDEATKERENRERSREKERHREDEPKQREKLYIKQEVKAVKVEEVSAASRRQRLEMMRRAQQQQEEMVQIPSEVQVKIQQPYLAPKNIQQSSSPPSQPAQEQPNNLPQPVKIKQERKRSENSSQESERQDSQEEEGPTVLTKPVFIAKTYRQAEQREGITEEQRKRRSIRYTTKLLLEENKQLNSEEENQETDSEFQNQTDIPNDDDTLNEEQEFHLWKIRELKRIRRERQEYRKYEMERKEIERRRQMSNEQILIENRALGSDATDNSQETKYVFMQKYYHKGAFYQDSEDEVFKRDYNLPTPMEMQDKSMLPKILQKRIGNFGKKGQSKYTHLTQEDTSDLNPLTRPDESLLDYWKKRTAGYKGTYGSNV